MITERNKRLGRDSIDRAKALCISTEKRKAVSAIDAGDEYFENCGWWLSVMVSRTRKASIRAEQKITH